MLEQHPLDGDNLRLELGDERPHLSLHDRETAGTVDAGIGANHAGGDGAGFATVFDTAVTTTRQTGIDAEHEHTYDHSRGVLRTLAWHSGCMSRRRKIVLGSLVAALVVGGLATDRWIVHPRIDDPGRADAIVVLGGGGKRTEYALDLARAGVAAEVIFASAYVEEQGVWSAMPCNSIRPPHLPDAVTFECFEPDPPTTKGEVRQIAAFAEASGWDTIVVVASKDQISRARLLLGRCWDGEARFTGPPHSQPWPIRAVYEWAATAKAQVLRGC